MHRTQRVFLGLAAVAAALLTAADPRAQADALAEMVDTERAFARMSVEVGQREAFLAFFSEDGVVFSPGPVNARRFHTERPPTPNPQARVLDWEPAVADVARSGDVGFSTGPFAVVDPAKGGRLAEGWFFSIWKRQQPGTWRVQADLGVSFKGVGPLRPQSVQRATPPGESPASGMEDAADVARRNDAVLGEALAGGNPSGYLPYVTSRTRVYRQGNAPAVGPVAIRQLLQATPPARCKPARAESSEAGDFVYVYGSCEVGATEGQARQAGYVRVWRRIEWGWVLGAEVVS